MKTKIFNFMLVFALVSLIFSGCKKDTSDNDVTAAKDDALAQQTFDNINKISDEAYSKTSSTKSGEVGGILYLCQCVTLSIDTTTPTHVLTIDFGTTNCLCYDGKYRRGSIVIAFNGHYRDSGSVHTTTFNNYFVNDNQVTGTRVRTNNGKNSNGNYSISYTANMSIILANNAGTITWNTSLNAEWIAGHDTPTWLDDVYLITGNSSGTRLNGTSYTKTITTALKKEMSCKWIESGIVEIVRSNKPTITIDFGDGTCDALATATMNGITYNITL